MKKTIAFITTTALAGALAACASEEKPGPIPADIPHVRAAVQTVPVASLDDAADDPAIWINEADPAASYVLGTDKRAGLNVYRLDGSLVQFFELGRLNNVDVRRNLTLEGWSGDLAAATNRTDNSVSMFAVDAEGVEHLGDFPSAFEEPYGFCMGMTAGALMAAITYKSGDVVLYRIDGPAAVTESQRLKLPSQLEGCVFDDAAGALFIGEETAGVWKTSHADGVYGEPEKIVAIDEENGMAADVEGLAIYAPEETGGWLIASSQGNNSYAVFERDAPHAFVGRFAIAPGEAMDGAEETDGIEATPLALGPDYPNGIFVVQDGFNEVDGEPGVYQAQNYKIVDWREIEAALGLGG